MQKRESEKKAMKNKTKKERKKNARREGKEERERAWRFKSLVDSPVITTGYP